MQQVAHLHVLQSSSRQAAAQRRRKPKEQRTAPLPNAAPQPAARLWRARRPGLRRRTTGRQAACRVPESGAVCRSATLQEIKVSCSAAASGAVWVRRRPQTTLARMQDQKLQHLHQLPGKICMTLQCLAPPVKQWP